MASRMDSMQLTIEALRASLTEIPTEVVSLRTAANASATQIATLTAASKPCGKALRPGQTRRSLM